MGFLRIITQIRFELFTFTGAKSQWLNQRSKF